MQHRLSFLSDGLKLSGILHVPDSRRDGERLAAFVVLHGFVGSKDESHAEIQARMLEEMGYAAFRFDMRCCGESEGERGQVRCFDQVVDTKNALTFIAGREEVDPKRIGVIGTASGPLSRSLPPGSTSVSPAWSRPAAGRRRAQVQGPASDARGLGQVHGHSRPRPRAQARDRREPVDVAVRRGPDPRPPAPEPLAQGPDGDPGRDRLEHVRFPGRRGGRADRPAAAPPSARPTTRSRRRRIASPLREGRDADRARPDHRHVAFPAEREGRAAHEGDHQVLLDKFFPSGVAA